MTDAKHTAVSSADDKHNAQLPCFTYVKHTDAKPEKVTDAEHID